MLRATSWPTHFSPAADPRIAPSRVLGRHPYDEGGNVRRRARATRPSRLRAVVFSGHKAPIPPQDGVRCDDAGDGCQAAPAEDSALHGQAPALVVGEAQTSGSPRGAKAPVLLEQIVNDPLLLSVDPPGEQQAEERDRRRQRVQDERVPRGAASV